MVDPVSIISLVLAAGETGARLTSAAEAWLEGDETDRILARVDRAFGGDTGLSTAGLQAWRSNEAFISALFAVSYTADWDAYRDDLRAAVLDLVAQDPDVPSEEDLVLTDSVMSEIENAMPHAKRGDELSRHLANRLDVNAERRHKAQLEIMKSLPERLAGRAAAGKGAAELLIRGPLDQPDVRNLVQQAEKVADDNPARAAELLIEAANRLQHADAGPLAETYRVRAAELLCADNQSGEAYRMLEDTARRQLGRASSWASITLSRYRRLARSEATWRVDALDANLDWLGDSAASREAALEAIRQAGDESEWRVGAVDVLVLLEDWDEVIRLTETSLDTEEWSLSKMFWLARAEALIAVDDKRVEDYWIELEDAFRAASPGDRALAWQRRAMRLALSDRPGEAREAYKEALRCWSEEPGFDDEIASCFYSSLNVAVLSGLPTSDSELMPLASELRGANASTAAWAEQREALAMRQRLDNRLRDAFFSYSEALRLYRLSGNLMGVIGAQERLAELFQESGRPEEAASFFVTAGKEARALKVAQDLDRYQLERVTAPRGPIWERRVRYRLLAKFGGIISEEFVAKHLDRLRADSEVPRARRMGPDLGAAARAALAGVLLQVPDEVRAEIAASLEHELRTGMPEDRRIAGHALVLGTQTGAWDATNGLVDAYLHQPQFSGVDGNWIADQAQRSNSVLKVVVEAARNGSDAALEAIALARLDSVPPDLVARAAERIGAASDLRTVERRDGQVKIGFGVRRERLGVLALLVPVEVRDQLARRLISAVVDSEEPEDNRASSMNALFNLAAEVSQGVAFQIADDAKPLAQGEYEPSPWDDDNEDPLSAVRISMHTSDALRVAALLTLGRIGGRTDIAADPGIAAVIEDAFEERDPRLLEAGIRAAGLFGVERPHRLTRFLSHEEPTVRQAALRLGIEQQRLNQDEADQALADPSPRVRQTLLQVEQPVELRRRVRAALAEDPHAYLRALATKGPSGHPDQGVP